ncbi:MAG: hypothetical protein ACJ8LD_18980, partial [Pantoea agglomerans]
AIRKRFALIAAINQAPVRCWVGSGPVSPSPHNPSTNASPLMHQQTGTAGAPFSAPVALPV